MFTSDRTPGSVRPAKVLRYYLDTTLGVPVADVVDTYGATHLRCRVVCPGGGDAQSYQLAPPPVDDPDQDIEVTGEVLLVMGPGRRPHPYVLGTCYVAGLAERMSDEATDQGDDVEYSELDHVYDRVTRHRGARMVFTYSGSWLVDLTTTGRPARFQLDADSYLRISQDDTADEYVLLGVKTLEHLRSIHTRLDELASKIDTVGTELANVTSTLETIETALNTLGVTLAPPVVLYTHTPVVDPWDFSKSASIAHASDGGSDNLLAGCFRVSSVPVADQE